MDIFKWIVDAESRLEQTSQDNYPQEPQSILRLTPKKLITIAEYPTHCIDADENPFRPQNNWNCKISFKSN